MRALTEAGITGARLARKWRRPPRSEGREAWSRWIAEHAPGRSFVDVGGLFGAAGEVAFAAEDAGARAVTLLDAGDAQLTTFPAARERRGSKVRFVQGDLADPATIARVGVHDVVWCTGVVYHTPDPVGQLMTLRRLCGQLLYLGARTIPEIPGVENGLVFYPHLSEGSRRAHARAYWGDISAATGVGAPVDERPMLGYGNFWFGITPSALRAMLRTARFEVVEERAHHEAPWLTELVARPLPLDPMLPPVAYYRERGEAHARGEPDLPFEDYYETRPGPPGHRE